MADQEKELTAEEAKALFDSVTRAEEEVETAKEALNDRIEEVSDAVQDIHEKLGSGPFEWKGKVVRVSKRKGIYSLREVEPNKPRAIG